MNKDSFIIVRPKPWHRWMVIPYETAYALFLIYTGLAGILGFGASSIVFNEGVKGADVFNILTIASGYLILSGSGLNRIRDEVLGLCTSIGLMLTRIFVIIVTTGYNITTHNLLAIFFLSLVASSIRLLTILKTPQLIDITQDGN